MQNLMEISFDYYKVFYEVARSHSITLAASHLCLTQPTVTKYIKNLEAVLNCQLFLRSQKGVSLTSEGQRLYRQISHPCQQMGQAQEVIREYVTNQDGRITISATELTMRYFLLPFMERFQHCFPNVKLQIHAHSFPTAITSLREETSDFALSITPLDNCYDFEVTRFRFSGYSDCRQPLFLSGEPDSFHGRDSDLSNHFHGNRNCIPQILGYSF